MRRLSFRMRLLSDFGQECRFTLFLCPSLLQVGKLGGLSLIFGSLELLSVSADFINYLVESVFKDGLLQLAFPDDDDEPAFCLQLAPHFLIAILIPSHLCRPEISVGLGNRIVFAAPVTFRELCFIDKLLESSSEPQEIKSWKIIGASSFQYLQDSSITI